MNERNFKIDWDSLDEVRRFFNQAKSRYLDLNRVASGIPSRKERQRRILDAAMTVWQSDISNLYTAINNSDKKFYVYVHMDTGKKIAGGYAGKTSFAATLGMTHHPFYVGKGTGDRCFDLRRSETHTKIRQRLALFRQDVSVLKILSDVGESDALQAEAKLIDIFGLLPYGGMLCNLDEGLNSANRRSIYHDAYRELSSIYREVTHVESNGVSR